VLGLFPVFQSIYKYEACSKLCSHQRTTN